MKSPPLILVSVQTMDVERLGDFYRSIGVRFARDRKDEARSFLAAAVLPRLVFEINPVNSRDGVDGTTRLAFAPRDFHGAMKALKACGAEFVEAPRGTEYGHRAVVRDPDGRIVELYARRTWPSRFIGFLRRVVTRPGRSKFPPIRGAEAPS